MPKLATDPRGGGVEEVALATLPPFPTAISPCFLFVLHCEYSHFSTGSPVPCGVWTAHPFHMHRIVLLVLGARGLLDVSNKLTEMSATTADMFEVLDAHQLAAPQGTERLRKVRGDLELKDVIFRCPSHVNC